GEAREPGEVAEKDADVLPALTRRREVEAPESLVPPLASRGEPDHEVGTDDQPVPLPPARVPFALAGERNADERFRQEHEARDHGRLKQVRTVAEDLPVAGGAGGVDERADCGHRRDQDAARRLALRPVKGRELREGPDQPNGNAETT